MERMGNIREMMVREDEETRKYLDIIQKYEFHINNGRD